MITPALEALARKLAASPRWRWLPGMLAVDVRTGVRIRLHADREGAIVRTSRGTSLYADYTVPESASRLPPGHEWIPDLSDPLTAAGLVVVAREVSGCAEAVAGTVNGRWMVFRSLNHYYRWREAYSDQPPPLTGVNAEDDVLDYATEVEALVAVILGAS